MGDDKQFETILVITVGLLVFYLWLDKVIFLYFSLGIAFAALLSSFLRRSIIFLWGKLAELLGFINGRILLTIVFYVFLTPIAFLSKVFSKSRIGKKKGNSSSYTDRNHLYVAQDLEKPW